MALLAIGVEDLLPLRSAFEHTRFMRNYSATVTLVQSDDEKVNALLR